MKKIGTDAERDERRRESSRKWARDHPEGRRLIEARRRAKNLAKGMTCNGEPRQRPIRSPAIASAIALDCAKAMRLPESRPGMSSIEWEAMGGKVEVLATPAPVPYSVIPCRGRVTGARASA